MTELYALNLQPYQNGRWRALLPTLPVERQQRALSFRYDPDRARAAGAGWLLQYALEQAGVPAEEQILEKTTLGKPYLKNRDDLFFSLSHSGNWAVCAVSDQPVGVDVEAPRCTMDIGRRFFRPEELEGLERLSFLECRDQLNRLWTAKEAFVKALGGGLTIPLNSFTVKLHPEQAVLEQDLSPQPYSLHEYQPDLCRICLCTVDERPELIILNAE